MGGSILHCQYFYAMDSCTSLANQLLWNNFVPDPVPTVSEFQQKKARCQFHLHILHWHFSYECGFLPVHVTIKKGLSYKRKHVKCWWNWLQGVTLSNNYLIPKNCLFFSWSKTLSRSSGMMLLPAFLVQESNPRQWQPWKGHTGKMTRKARLKSLWGEGFKINSKKIYKNCKTTPPMIPALMKAHRLGKFVARC